MKARVMICTMIILLCSFTGNVFGGTEGPTNTFYGTDAGANTTGPRNTLIGAGAGFNNTTGHWNTFIGTAAGYDNTTGYANTFLGDSAGAFNITGYGNVFLGYTAGEFETGSNKLYIDNSDTSTPLIYGEFDNEKMTINGNLTVIGPESGLVRLSDNTDDDTMKASRIVLNHYANTEKPVYLFGSASTGTDNFVALGGGSDIGNAATQIDLFTAPDTTTEVGYPRVTVKGNGYVGIGTQSPFYPLQMAGGAYSTGTSWVNASSREYKENIEVLSVTEAVAALQELNPVKFNYKAEPKQKQVGFIAEDVPELVAMNDRKGLSTMDIVAVLTRVVQEQNKKIKEQQKAKEEQDKAIKEQDKVIGELIEKITDLEKEIRWNRSLANLSIHK